MKTLADYFAVLELNGTESPRQIKSKRRKLAFLYHPDRPEGDEAKFKAIEDAYSHIKIHWENPDVEVKPEPEEPPEEPQSSNDFAIVREVINNLYNLKGTLKMEIVVPYSSVAGGTRDTPLIRLKTKMGEVGIQLADAAETGTPRKDNKITLSGTSGGEVPVTPSLSQVLDLIKLVPFLGDWNPKMILKKNSFLVYHNLKCIDYLIAPAFMFTSSMLTRLYPSINTFPPSRLSLNDCACEAIRQYESRTGALLKAQNKYDYCSDTPGAYAVQLHSSIVSVFKNDNRIFMTWDGGPGDINIKIATWENYVEEQRDLLAGIIKQKEIRVELAEQERLKQASKLVRSIF